MNGCSAVAVNGARVGELSDDDPGGANELPVELVAADDLPQDEVVPVGIVHRLHLDGFGGRRIEGLAEDRDPLEALALQDLEQLVPNQDEALGEPLVDSGALGRFEGAIQVVENLDEAQQENLSLLVELPHRFLRVTLPQGVHVGAHLPIALEGFREPGFRQVGPLPVGLELVTQDVNLGSGTVREKLFERIFGSVGHRSVRACSRRAGTRPPTERKYSDVARRCGEFEVGVRPGSQLNARAPPAGG